MSSTDFYHAFEERYRGSRELIRTRLQAYQPFIGPLPGIYQPANAIDLGCGRGEWLELLQGSGFAPQGVDLDAGMLAACTGRGLPVTQGDALAHLKSLGDESQCIVSGFHIAEHITFEDLKTLVQQALRVLKAGGLLILETPNPENVVVGTSSFYLDPTHLRPIPPLLLSFLPEHYGFARVRTVRLQESPELHQRSDIRMMDVLSGVSPDYAIVAQKAAAPAILARFNAAFAAPYGIELHELARRFDGTLDRRINAIDQRLTIAEAHAGGMIDALGRIGSLQDRLLVASAQLARTQTAFEHLQSEAVRATHRMETGQAHAGAMESRAQEQEQRAAAAEVLAHGQQKRIDELGRNAHHWWQQACALENERNALLQSWSWRITTPLRFVAGLALHPIPSVRMGANRVVQRMIIISERPLSRLMAAVLRRPQLSNRINQWLLRYPALYQQLLDVAHRGGVVPGAPVYAPDVVQAKGQAAPELASLTPRARQIYADLKTAIQDNKRTD